VSNHPFYCASCDSSAWIDASSRSEAKEILVTNHVMGDRPWITVINETMGEIVLCPVCSEYY